MSEYKRGSEWRRWDLHLHTPDTIKSDQFTGESGNTSDEKWDKFYSDITAYVGDGSDPIKNIVAIGITDYLSIDTYKKVKADNRLPVSIKLVIPNVEMRIQPMAADAPINIHFLFDPAIVDSIESRFFSKLSFTYGTTVFSACKLELIRLGKQIDSTLNDEKAYKKGIEQFVASFESVKKVFDDDVDLKKDVIILVSNSTTDGVSGAVNHSHYIEGDGTSQLTLFRQSIYKFSDAIFSAQPSDIKYFLGKGNTDSANEVISKCGSLKPCLHGCDAHENTKIFEPAEKRYCWIKADPTFNGLKQVIYEPEERVRISELKPETKQGYYVIDRVEFTDKEFPTQPIYFSDKLTCIIGGKSTGKSIFLHNLALAIDRKQAEEKALKASTSTKMVEEITIYWADGKDAARKIVYIPQTYLNRLSDEKEEKTEIDSIIQDVVLLNPNLKKVFNEVHDSIKAYKPNLDKLIYDLLESHRELAEINAKRRELGDKAGIEAEISKLKAQKDKLSRESSLTEEELKSYDEAVEKIDSLKRQISVFNAEIETIASLFSVVISKSIEFSFSKETRDEIDMAIRHAIESADTLWISVKQRLIEKITANRVQKETELVRFKEIEENLKEKVQGNQAINELSEKIRIETNKLEKFSEMEHQYNLIAARKNDIMGRVVGSMNFYCEQHNCFADAVNSNDALRGDDLEFSVEVPFRCEAFLDTLNNIINNRRSATFKTVINPEGFTSENYTTEKVCQIVEFILNGEFILKKNNTPETALRSILTDWYNIIYRVKMDGDAIDVMSPGKKALVLLKLLISLANSKCPILIDQPEDDLDNRSIFNDLIPFIKSKKKDRQIIVVTHNANIVLGSDAEEVIIANQDGKNSPNNEFRFEYRSGSIENDMPVIGANGRPESGILNSQGIQQHICDILEGGEKAFDLRKQKYHI